MSWPTKCYRYCSTRHVPPRGVLRPGQHVPPPPFVSALRSAQRRTPLALGKLTIPPARGTAHTVAHTARVPQQSSPRSRGNGSLCTHSERVEIPLEPRAYHYQQNIMLSTRNGVPRTYIAYPIQHFWHDHSSKMWP